LDIPTCAQYHVDKHVVKMPLEAAQMLCTNTWIDQALGQTGKLDKYEIETLRNFTEEYRSLEPADRPIPYLPAMFNHPCTIWARNSIENHYWLFEYAQSLGEEYTYRYNKIHKSIGHINKLPDIQNMADIGLTEFAQAMPDKYKNEDPVTAYRNYYIGEKAALAQYKYRERPTWFQQLG